MSAVRPPRWLIVVFVGALVGIVFAGVSTWDFVQHLDRQVHSLHCSFIPGMGHGAGESGCQVAMMSPYSSVFRTRVWGGIPISLPAMAVFAFIAFYGLDLLLTRRTEDRRATAFLALATALPALASIVMLMISLLKLGTACKLCIAIYLASALCLTGGILLWRRAVKLASPEPVASNAFLGGMFGVGVAFVVVPVILYLAMSPDHAKFLGTCENLTKTEDPYGVMVKFQKAGSGVPAIEILDPLCPACRAFEERLGHSGLGEKLDRKAILFPLDTECNWMITETTHPGACTVSEAVLCAGDRAPEVLAWAFEVQDRVRAEAKTDKTAAARIVKERFPELAACVGSAEARSRLNKSMRWAVSHNIRVLTPQLFVDGVKLCDEDVDLGLEYALACSRRTIAASASGRRPRKRRRRRRRWAITTPAPPPRRRSRRRPRTSGPLMRSPRTRSRPSPPPTESKPADKPTEPKADEAKPADKLADKPADEAKPVTKPSGEAMPPRRARGQRRWPVSYDVVGGSAVSAKHRGSAVSRMRGGGRTASRMRGGDRVVSVKLDGERGEPDARPWLRGEPGARWWPHGEPAMLRWPYGEPDARPWLRGEPGARWPHGEPDAR